MDVELLPFEVISPPGDTLGESASWCARTQRLWWVDIRAPRVKRWDSATGTVASWSTPELCAAAVPTADPEVAVLPLRAGLHTLDTRTGTVSPLLTLERDAPENRLNEARCDRQGRLWCGSMWDYGKHPTGALYRIDPQLGIHTERRNVTVPNGIAFSPDGRRMYFTDTPGGRIECADYDADTGTPSAWRTWVDAGIAHGKPDGATVDADGCLWSTRVGAGCLARFTPAGRLDRLIRLPVSTPTSCSFGGARLDTLFVTSATQRLSPQLLAAEPLAGAVLALRPGVQGLGEPHFAWRPGTPP